MVNKFIKQAWLKDIKVLVWDLDGTLYKSRPEIDKIFKNHIYNKVASSFKVSLLKATKIFYVQKKKSKGLTATLNSLGIDGYSFYKMINKKIPWSALLTQDKKLNAMLKRMPAFKHFLLTDNFAEDAFKKLAVLGVDKNIFDKNIFGLELKITKPNKFLFKKALEKADFPAKSFLMIGDSDARDIKPARKVGMKTCLIWGKSKIADISLETVYDVEKLFVER